MIFRKVARWTCLVSSLSFCLSVSAQEGAGDPADAFRNPPAISRPGVWWHWMGCNVSKEGIARDLEALKEAGFGSATIFGIADTCSPWACPITNSPTAGLIAFTDPWWKLVAHAASEARRLGLDLGVHNCPGYTHSGGPWIPPELSMLEVCWSNTPVTGGKQWSGTLPRPQVDPRANMYFPMFNEDTGTLEKPVIEARKTFYRDVAVLALPASGVVPKDQVIDMTRQMDAEGKLTWNAPAGEWIVYRVGCTTMGSMTVPNQWQTRGLECDKMSVEANEFHLKHLLGDMKRNLGDLVGTGLKHVLFDSYEAGIPSWTPKMPEEFAARRGYSLLPFLATFAGRVVGSDAETAKFRSDFDRTIWDLHRDVHFATTSRMLREAGLRFTCEPYVGPWQVGEVAPHVARVMTEFWTNDGRFGGALVGVDGGIMNGGHNILDAEAFTGMPAFSKWTEYPDWLKPIGDGAFCAGINRMVFHEYAHQPWDSRFRPGVTMGLWGSHFGRWQTWWEPGKAWVAYLARCQALLQWGKPATGGFRTDAKQGEVSLCSAHRKSGETEVFFVANQARAAGVARCVFGVTGMAPELWDPVTGDMRELPDFANRERDCTVTLEFAPVQSWFVVFRRKASAPRASGGAGEPEAGRLSAAANFPPRTQVGEPFAGPWTVQFDPAWGGPAQAEFAQLEDWTKRPEPGIRHYSGTATYRSSFTADITDRRCFLDLGQVNYIARVRINDHDLGVVWTPPWGVTIPAGLLKAGKNSVEIEVTNVWANRLIGDEQEPADCEWLQGHVFGPNLCGGRYLKRFPDWFVNKTPRPSKGRYCFTTWNYFTKDSQLVPSGLLGPVRLLAEGSTAR